MDPREQKGMVIAATMKVRMVHSGGWHVPSQSFIGTYTVRAVEPDSSWHCSAPSPCRRSVGLVSGQDAVGKDFGSYQDVALSGIQYDDANGNGTRNAGEGGVAGRTITLDPGTPSDSSDDLTTTTGSDGSYSFGGLRP